MPGVGDVSVVDGQGGLEGRQLLLQAGNQLQGGSLLTLQHGATPLSNRSEPARATVHTSFSDARANMPAHQRGPIVL